MDSGSWPGLDLPPARLGARRVRDRYERNPGRMVTIAPGEEKDVLDLRWRDEVSRVICVTLVGPAAREGTLLRPTSCVAVVAWGAGDAEAEAEIDFGVGGVVFTVPASSIRITARYEKSASATAVVPQDVRLGAFASTGSGDRQSRLTRTRYHDAGIAAGGTVSFETPRFGKSVRVLVGDQASRAYRLDFFGNIVPGPDYAVEVAAGAEAPLVDLAPDVVSVRLVNTTGTVLPAGARAVFQLGI